MAQTVTLLIHSGDGHCDSRPLPRLSRGLTQFYSVIPVKFSYRTWKSGRDCSLLHPFQCAVCHHPNHAASCDVRQLGPRRTRLTGAGESRRLLSDLYFGDQIRNSETRGEFGTDWRKGERIGFWWGKVRE